MNLTKTKTDVLIDETIDHLSIHADFLRLYTDPEQILMDIPILQIRSIMIIGSDINIPARLIKMCNTNSIPLHLLTECHRHNGSLYFSIHPNIKNRQQQFLACLDPDWHLYLAKQILHQKTQTQILAQKYWKNDHRELTKYQDKIANLTHHQSLMGNEGASAVLYWDSFGKQIGQQFCWYGRIKNPCKDPVNSLLSLAYSLLSTQCQSSLTLNGLDPYLGILHKTNDDRPALVYDIMEIYRVLIVDFWVLGLLKTQKFVPEDFTQTRAGNTTLKADKKNEFFSLWFKRLKYYKFDTNHGKITIHQFMEKNTDLLIEWFAKINDHKERDTGRFDKLPERLIVFEDIQQFESIYT